MLKKEDAFELGVQRGKEYFWQSRGFDEGKRIAEKEAKDIPKANLDEQQKKLIKFHQIVDKQFDEMLAKVYTVLEAIGALHGKDFEPPNTEEEVREVAIKKLIKVAVRELQNRLKDEF